MLRTSIWLLLLATYQVSCQANDLLQLNLEELMDIKVYAASKYSQNQADAPSSVSIITAADIRSFGWRNLGELLRSQRGMYLSYDRIYGYLGARGLLVSGDLNSRLLITIDGHRISDVVYEQAFLMNDFILDTDLIERVEIIRGPNSTLHGATPLVGVINIVSREAGIGPQHEFAIGLGSGHRQSGRYTYNRKFENDAKLLLSASKMDSKGENLTFNYPSIFTGVTNNTDFEHTEKLLSKFKYQNTQVFFAHAQRIKGIPTGATGAVFDNTNNHYTDTQTAFNLSQRWQLADTLELEGRFYLGSYDFSGNLVYQQNNSYVTNRDLAWGRWQGVEWQFHQQGEQHNRIIGLEYQHNSRQEQQNYDIAGTEYLHDKRNSSRYGIYMQDEWRRTNIDNVTLGLRYDRDYLKQQHLSPKLAWIIKPDEKRTFKLLTSAAYRTPNVAEVYYAYGDAFAANTNLKSEFVRNYEAVFEHQLTAQTHYTINPFHMQIRQRIVQNTLDDGRLQYQNLGSVQISGIELETQHQLSNNKKLQVSYSWQQGKDHNNTWLTDSPKHIARLAYRTPFLSDTQHLGVEWQYSSPRKTFKGELTENTKLLNINLNGRLLNNKISWSVGLYNVLNYHYHTPDTPDPVIKERDRILQDRKQWHASVKAAF